MPHRLLVRMVLFAYFAAMLHPALFIGPTAQKGRGVFATISFAEGTVIEISPVLVMEPSARPLLDKTALHDYIFEWQPDGKELCCVAWGYLSMYNHSYASNAEYCMDYEAETMSITTVRAIAAGEEITINYNGDWDDARSIWFDAVD